MKNSLLKLNILVTGGAGYIGSHTVKLLLAEGMHEIVVLDNLSRGFRNAVPGGIFIKKDLSAQKALCDILKKYRIDAVLHFAGYTSVAESMENPDLYFKNNVLAGSALLEAMRECKVNKIIFSSSAAVYGESKKNPIKEDCLKNPSNIYGFTKAEFENLLDYYHRVHGLEYVSLRYFNVAGADFDGKLGERHTPENHIIPVILKKMMERNGLISIYGTDYPTSDGTCVRDFVHVEDVARAHLLALRYLQDHGGAGIFNLGSNRGYSVREIIETCQKVTGVKINAVEQKRRSGDPAVLVADCSKAKKILKWRAEYNLYEMINHAWNFFKKNCN